jgi:5-methylcytosine-specific restriction endonuclease McrA
MSEHKKIRNSVFKRDNYQCLKCGSKENLTLDHIIPKSKGGKFTRRNLQTLCFKCNLEKKTDIQVFTKNKNVVKMVKINIKKLEVK